MICLHHKNGTKNQIPCIPGGTIKYVLYNQLYVTYLYTIVALITKYIYIYHYIYIFSIYIQYIYIYTLHIIYTIYNIHNMYTIYTYIQYIVERLK